MATSTLTHGLRVYREVVPDATIEHSTLGIIHTLWLLAFPYCSPLLIFNALLVFLIFSRFKIQSHIINSLASSTFAVYLIHCHPAVHKYIIMPLMGYYVANSICPPPVHVFVISIAGAILVMIGSILIDKALYPVWKLETISRNYLLKRIGCR